ncbi:hypothetical protein M427DRAFT_142139 [Gonapodya prolifera JEL478]|uniref:Uncharacterized protein n=1 Tax=Gonapodya prolifera (strain JEL478) TaxID=1344416 RepID=A0A139AYV0_GONPJ|nr:hypothetical protein M427DRAFT_142139 [Gonapodya prolifera JEL478]|eukprot:KXS21733.1 hypothetical protein M427DRAFT_142139 [Gonapodya prolifera JEL478]
MFVTTGNNKGYSLKKFMSRHLVVSEHKENEEGNDVGEHFLAAFPQRSLLFGAHPPIAWSRLKSKQRRHLLFPSWTSVFRYLASSSHHSKFALHFTLQTSILAHPPPQSSSRSCSTLHCRNDRPLRPFFDNTPSRTVVQQEARAQAYQLAMDSVPLAEERVEAKVSEFFGESYFGLQKLHIFHDLDDGLRGHAMGKCYPSLHAHLCGTTHIGSLKGKAGDINTQMQSLEKRIDGLCDVLLPKGLHSSHDAHSRFSTWCSSTEVLSFYFKNNSANSRWATAVQGGIGCMPALAIHSSGDGVSGWGMPVPPNIKMDPASSEESICSFSTILWYGAQTMEKDGIYVSIYKIVWVITNSPFSNDDSSQGTDNWEKERQEAADHYTKLLTEAQED